MGWREPWIGARVSRGKAPTPFPICSKSLAFSIIIYRFKQCTWDAVWSPFVKFDRKTLKFLDRLGRSYIIIFILKMNSRDLEFLSLAYTKFYGRHETTKIDVMYSNPNVEKCREAMTRIPSKAPTLSSLMLLLIKAIAKYGRISALFLN